MGGISYPCVLAGRWALVDEGTDGDVERLRADDVLCVVDEKTQLILPP